MNTQQALKLLGYDVRDRITTFKGTVTGVVIYLSGCHQALVVPKVGKDGKIIEVSWFDVQRLEILSRAPLALDNDETPGHDAEPPRR